MVDAGVDMFVIQGTTVSAEHVSAQAEPLNLKRFIAELDVPVIVGGCATYQAALHLMRTGAAGMLVGFGGGAANTTRAVLGVGVPMASAIADVAAPAATTSTSPAAATSTSSPTAACARGGDIAKAIACGADAVMIGSPLARATEHPARGWHWGPRPTTPSCRAATACGSRPSARSRRCCSARPAPTTARRTCSAACVARWR